LAVNDSQAIKKVIHAKENMIKKRIKRFTSCLILFIYTLSTGFGREPELFHLIIFKLLKISFFNITILTNDVIRFLVHFYCSTIGLQFGVLFEYLAAQTLNLLVSFLSVDVSIVL